MKKTFNIFCLLILLLVAQSCGIYSFGGVTLDDRIKTVQIDYFPNSSPLVEPTLSQEFTLALQDLFLSQTNLNLVNSGGDLLFEGEITGYRINPMTATSQQTAAQNRLTVTVNIRYFNKYEEENDFERSFSFYHDYDANSQLTGSVLDEAFEVILERITQDIFNESVAKW
jgi:hypothetical protein